MTCLVYMRYAPLRSGTRKLPGMGGKRMLDFQLAWIPHHSLPLVCWVTLGVTFLVYKYECHCPALYNGWGRGSLNCLSHSLIQPLTHHVLSTYYVIILIQNSKDLRFLPE